MRGYNGYRRGQVWFNRMDERVRQAIRAGALLRRPAGVAVYRPVQLVGPTPFAPNGAVKMQRLDEPRVVLVSYRDVARMLAITTGETF